MLVLGVVAAQAQNASAWLVRDRNHGTPSQPLRFSPHYAVQGERMEVYPAFQRGPV